MGKRSLHYRLNERETGVGGWPAHRPLPSSTREPLNLLRHASGHAALIRRLEQTSVLRGHEAPVTAVSWNGAGTRVISSSDDCRVKIWDVQSSKMTRTIETGHTKSIYSIRFMPDSNDHYLLSCSADKEVRLVNLVKQAVRPFHCHHDRVKAIVPLSAFEFMSAGDSGKVCHHDTRLPVCSCENSSRSGKDCSHLLLHQTSMQGSALGINTMAVHPLQPNLFATGGNDAAVRLYDLRMLTDNRNTRSSKPSWISCFSPQHMRTTTGGFSGMVNSRYVTGVAFNHNGASLIASYGRENIYSFNVAEHSLHHDSPAFRSDGGHRSWYGMLRPPIMRGSGRVARRAVGRASQDHRDMSPSGQDALGGALRRNRGGAHAGRGSAEGAATARGGYPEGRSDLSLSDSEHRLIEDSQPSQATGQGAPGNRRASQASPLNSGFLMRQQEDEPGRSDRPSSLSGAGPSGNTRGYKRPRRETERTAEGGSAQGFKRLRRNREGDAARGVVQRRNRFGREPEEGAVGGGVRDSLNPSSTLETRGDAATAQAQPNSFVFERLYRSEARGLQLRPRQGSAPSSTVRGAAVSFATQGAGPGIEGPAAVDARQSNTLGRRSARRGGLLAGLNAAFSPFDRSNSLLRRGLNAFAQTSSMASHGHQERGVDAGDAGVFDRGEEPTVGAPDQPQAATDETERASSPSQRDREVPGAPPEFDRNAPGSQHAPLSRLGATVEDERCEIEEMHDMSFTCCYKGHRNQSTTKDVTLLGGRSEFVVSGSDDGHIFIWDFSTGTIVNILSGEDDGVSSVAAHPHDPVLASTGSEDTVRIWSPSAQEATLLQDMDVIIRRNTQELASGEQPRQPPPVLLNMLQGTAQAERPRRAPIEQPMGNCAIQ